MNRIVLIGNGFDLNHSLKTSYNDFLNYLINSTAEFIPNGRGAYNPIVHGVVSNRFHNFIQRKDENGNLDKWLGVEQVENYKFEYKLKVSPLQDSIYFNSLISEKEKLGKWSDLESHYFKLLSGYSFDPNSIEKINEEFEHLTNLLYIYLKNIVEDKTNISSSYGEIENNKIFRLLQNKYSKNEFEKTYFVSFNYTSRILNYYYKHLNSSEKNRYPIHPIYIHGDLFGKVEDIIFGYGDENSEEYKKLELKLDNQLLKNFKTFKYLRTNKYNEILGLLADSDDNYIQLIGHSCGLCDKALLRTIFQDRNVKKIEAVYHTNESYYFENLYNISRIFDDNTLMRKKLVSLEDTAKI